MRLKALVLAVLVTLWTLASCARTARGSNPRANEPVDSGARRSDAGPPRLEVASADYLQLGEVCASRHLSRTSPKCAPGLVCCYHATGVYDPNAQAHCVTPCKSGPFCMNGCYSPPVP